MQKEVDGTGMSFGKPTEGKDQLIKDLNDRILELEDEQRSKQNVVEEKERLMNMKNMDLRNNLDRQKNKLSKAEEYAFSGDESRVI